MIIDTHCHIGLFGELNMTEELVSARKKYNIDLMLCSNGDAVEYTDKMVLLENRPSQVEISKATIDFCRKNDGFGALLWLKPATEVVTEELEKLIEENRDIVYGLKFHPFYSNLPFSDEKYIPYIELARKYNLPIQIHTATNDNCRAYDVYETAKKYPDVKFILAHLELVSDNLLAIEYISMLDNLYGDTAWVSSEKTYLAIKECGMNKIMFGTDNPIDGIDTYAKYSDYFEGLKNILTKEEYDCLMYKNAKKVFNIK